MQCYRRHPLLLQRYSTDWLLYCYFRHFTAALLLQTLIIDSRLQQTVFTAVTVGTDYGSSVTADTAYSFKVTAHTV
jgi:hypothetical protein